MERTLIVADKREVLFKPARRSDRKTIYRAGGDLEESSRPFLSPCLGRAYPEELRGRKFSY